MLVAHALLLLLRSARSRPANIREEPPKMRIIILSVSALFMSLALLVSGNAMLTTLTSLRLNIEQVSDTTLGLILALYSVGFIAGAASGIKVIRQVGHIRAYAAFAAVACATTLMHPLILNAEAWMLMRFALGFCVAGLMTVTESGINDRATAGENSGAAESGSETLLSAGVSPAPQ